MFSRKKPAPPKRRNHDLSQFGLTEIPDDFDPTGGNSDSDLEAELAAISGGGEKVKRKPKATLLPSSELDKMIAESLRDDDVDDDDESHVDENDPDLLGELQTITGIDNADENAELSPEESQDPTSEVFLPTTTVDTISVIKQRIGMYNQAEAIAKSSGEAAKARRLARGIKTLMDLLKQASTGKIINVDDIPPEVSIKLAATPDVDEKPTAPPLTDEAPKLLRPAPPPPVPQNETLEVPPIAMGKEDDDKTQTSMLIQMRTRQAEYKKAALQSKRTGDTTTALQFLKVVKQFDMVIKLCEEGKEIDLSDMPPPPDQFLQFMSQMQASSVVPPESIVTPALPEITENEETISEISTPTTLLEALKQRLEKYKSVEESAKAEGNSSKARRFGRIVKQYEDAIKCNQAGRAVAYDELPVPPGYGPLPTLTSSTASPPSVKSTSNSSADTEISAVDKELPTKSVIPKISKIDPPPPSPRPELTTRVSGNQQKNNLAEQQMKILLERQREFKLAAVEAKKAGEIEQAKEYLKIYKGFDALLNAASSGLPVDLQTLPVPPSQRDNLEASFAIVTTDECDPDDDIADISVRVEEQLAKQLMMCKNTRDHHKAMGDIAGMNRFENLALTVQKDLDLVRYSKRKNFPLPKFHYESRSFNIVHCNTDLTDNELEMVVVRGINYNVANPKDVDTYVRVEFPLLNDESFKTKTTLIKDSDSPDYNQRFKVDIQRSNRQFQRIFKRHGVKFEVYSRGGFLRSDILIGTVNVKLQPLETKCDIHETFDLMEGRKTVGGKLELKIRVRNPILTKQIEHINEKWLVLDT